MQYIASTVRTHATPDMQPHVSVAIIKLRSKFEYGSLELAHAELLSATCSGRRAIIQSQTRSGHLPRTRPLRAALRNIGIQCLTCSGEEWHHTWTSRQSRSNRDGTAGSALCNGKLYQLHVYPFETVEHPRSKTSNIGPSQKDVTLKANRKAPQYNAVTTSLGTQTLSQFPTRNGRQSYLQECAVANARQRCAIAYSAMLIVPWPAIRNPFFT